MTTPAAPAVSGRAEGPPRPGARVSVAGLGRGGLAHLAILAMIPGCEIVGVVEPDAARARAARGMGWKVPRHPTIESLLAAGAPDALFVSLPPDRHLATARPALEAGLAVLVDKPLAHTLADAEALASAAAAAGRPLAAGCLLIHEPVFAAAREALASGALGRVRQARCSMYVSEVFEPRHGWRYDPARSGGGVVTNVSSELLFLVDATLAPPVEVRATWNRIYGEVEDELHAMMRLADGVEVGFDCSWSVPGYARPAVVVELEGENGKLLVSDDALELELAAARGGRPAGHSSVRATELPQPARFDLDGEALYLQDSRFLSWVAGGAPPPGDAAAALRVQRLIDALYRSAGLGGAAVEMAP
jgi:predicted dehydrogenase